MGGEEITVRGRRIKGGLARSPTHLCPLSVKPAPAEGIAQSREGDLWSPWVTHTAGTWERRQEGREDMEARSDLQNSSLLAFCSGLCDYPAHLASSLTSDIVTSSASWRKPARDLTAPRSCFLPPRVLSFPCNCLISFSEFVLCSGPPGSVS